MPFYEKGTVRIHYEEAGSGFPLLVIPGGGLNSTVAGLANHPFNPLDEFKGEYRVIAADLRNANGGQSSGPLEIDRPWDAYTDDHLGLMDHLGIREFMVLGFCIGGPFIWNLLKRAPGRIVAGVLAQPSGFRPTMPDLFYQNNIKGWAPGLCERQPDITMETGRRLPREDVSRQRRFCVHRDPRFRQELPDADSGVARRRPGPPLRGGVRERTSRTQCAGQHLSVEGEPGADPARAAPRARVPQGKSAGERGAATDGRRRPIKRVSG